MTNGARQGARPQARKGLPVIAWIAIGCGGIVSGAHLPAYRAAGLHVSAVFDLDADKARKVAQDFDIPAVAPSAEALAAREDVDIVDVAVLPWVQPQIVGLVAAAGGLAASRGLWPAP